MVIPIAALEKVQPVPVIVLPVIAVIDPRSREAKLHGRFIAGRIIRYVAAEYGLVSDHIKSPTRTAQIVRARQIAMFLVREITGQSFPWIGKQFGGRDHTTVLWGVRKTEALARAHIDFAAEVAEHEHAIRSDQFVSHQGEAP